MERPEVCNCEQALALQKEVEELQVRLELAQGWIDEDKYDEYDQADEQVRDACRDGRPPGRPEPAPESRIKAGYCPLASFQDPHHRAELPAGLVGHLGGNRIYRCQACGAAFTEDP